MSLNLFNTVIAKDEELEVLISKLGNLVDGDHNGTNGEEFCWDATLENGCKSNIEFVVKQYLKGKQEDGQTLGDVFNNIDIVSLIECSIEEIYLNDSWYLDFEHHVTQVGDTLVVSVATLTNA